MTLIKSARSSSNLKNKEKQATPFLRLPLEFDVTALQAELAYLQQQEWITHYNNGTTGDDWQCQALRSAEGRTDHILAFSDKEFLDTPLLKQCRYFQKVLSSFQCQTLSVRLMVLNAGAKIAEHTDDRTGFEDGLARLHIPIITHQDVLFWLDDIPVHFNAGAVWYMNGNSRHRVENNSMVNRIHLVIDCVTNQWLSDLFYASGFTPNPPSKYGDHGVNDANVLHVINALRENGDEVSVALAENLEKIRNAS